MSTDLVMYVISRNILRESDEICVTHLYIYRYSDIRMYIYIYTYIHIEKKDIDLCFFMHLMLLVKFSGLGPLQVEGNLRCSPTPCCCYCVRDTLPETNIFAPKNDGFQQESPFPGGPYFQGRLLLVSGSVWFEFWLRSWCPISSANISWTRPRKLSKNIEDESCSSQRILNRWQQLKMVAKYI